MLNNRRQRLESVVEAARRTSIAAQLVGPEARERWAVMTLDARRSVLRELFPAGITLDPIGRGRWRAWRENPASTVHMHWFDADETACRKKEGIVIQGR